MHFEENKRTGDVGEQKWKPEVHGAKPERAAVLEGNPGHK